MTTSELLNIKAMTQIELLFKQSYSQRQIAKKLKISRHESQCSSQRLLQTLHDTT